MSALVMSRAGEVTANVHLTYTDITSKNIGKIAKDVTSAVNAFGGAGVILYGDFGKGVTYSTFDALSRELQKTHVRLNDAIRVNGLYSESISGNSDIPAKKVQKDSGKGHSDATSEQKAVGEALAGIMRDAGIEVVTDVNKMRQAMGENISGTNAKVQHLKTPEGEVYGFVKDGKVYLDPETMNANTPVHEYTHLWDRALQQANPKLWEKGKELMKQLPLWNEVEARNASGRMDMSEKERRNTTLAETEDVSRDKQIVLNGDTSGAMASMDGSKDGETGHRMHRMSDGPDTFKQRREDAIKNIGTVAPGLAEKEFEVKHIDRHGYKGHDVLSQAEKAAIERYTETKVDPRTGKGEREPKVLHYDNDGQKFDYIISAKSIRKARRAYDNSENIGVHIAVMDRLDDVINASIECEEHPSVRKGPDGKRKWGNKMDGDILIHRFVSAIELDGEIHRVKITMKEYLAPDMTNGHYTYEVLKIETPSESTPDVSNGAKSDSKENKSFADHDKDYKDTTEKAESQEEWTKRTISGQKLLNGMTKTYDEGKTLLDDSAGTRRHRQLRGIDELVAAGAINGEPTAEQVQDDEELRWLESLGDEDVEYVYRAMQLVDGKLYPPMAAVVDGQYVEPSEIGRWEKAVERPDLVTVKMAVPKSELTSGYKADKAKDAVGERSWHEGPVRGALSRLGKPRKVILTRWAKPVEILTDAKAIYSYNHNIWNNKISYVGQTL